MCLRMLTRWPPSKRPTAAAAPCYSAAIRSGHACRACATQQMEAAVQTQSFAQARRHSADMHSVVSTGCHLHEVCTVPNAG
jgi:hypothetical protein